LKLASSRKTRDSPTKSPETEGGKFRKRTMGGGLTVKPAPHNSPSLVNVAWEVGVNRSKKRSHSGQGETGVSGLKGIQEERGKNYNKPLLSEDHKKRRKQRVS